MHISSAGPSSVSPEAVNQNQRQNTGTCKSGRELSDSQQREVEKLKQRDMQVKRHEQAHMAAGSGLTGGAHYTYQVGPDGKRYAVGGEVSIDASAEKDPRATISKMQRVKRAALAPADPSATDRAVARKADANIRSAQAELQKQQREENENLTQPPGPGSLVDVSV